MDVAEGLLPVLFAMALGFGAGKLRLLDNRHVDGLNTIVMKIALPIALFTILASSDRADVIEHAAVAGAVLVVMVVVFVGVYLMERRAFRLPTPGSALQALTVAFPNTAAVGLPIADAVLGRTGGLAVAVSLAVGTLTLTPATIAIMERSTATGTPPGRARAIGRALRAPVAIAPVLGIAWSLVGLPFPALLESTLSEVGNLTAGLALFLTGLVLSSQRLRLSTNALVSTLIAVVVRPALALLFVKAVGMSGAMAQETVLLLAIPSGFFGVLLAVRYKSDPGVTGPTVFFSTLLSIVTLAIVIMMLPTL